MSAHTVLLVDDSEEDCELLGRALRQAGFPHRLVVAGDGAEALDYFFARGKYEGRDRRVVPVLTLLDLKMPRVGGLEVLRALRTDAVLRSLAVVILTSSDEERDRLEASALGVTLYFTKPRDFDGYIGLARRLRDMLSHLER